MNRNAEWPWSFEEEAEWKAELEERDYYFLEELIDTAIEDATNGSRDVRGLLQQEEPAEDETPATYSIAA